MPEFPAITHVALTVTSLERSVPWYKDLFGSDPILDEDTGPFQRVAWLTGGTIVPERRKRGDGACSVPTRPSSQKGPPFRRKVQPPESALPTSMHLVDPMAC